MYKVISGNYTLSLTDQAFLTNTKKIYLQCRTSLGAVNILLPKILTSAQTWGFEIYVNDIDGNASNNNITITPNGVDKINGVSSPIVINSDGANGFFEVIDVDNWEYIQVGNANLGAVLQATLMYNVNAADLNAMASANPITVTYPDTHLANSVVFGGYYRINEGFVSASGASFDLNNFSSLSPDVNLWNGNLQQAKVGTSDIYYNGAIIQTTLKQGSQSTYGRYTFYDNTINPVNNPKNWTAGDLDVFIQYFAFQV